MRQARSAPAAGPATDGVLTADDDLLLGRYRLLKRLGEGGMGVVWLADDTRLHRRVAVKRINGGAEVGGAKRAGREAVAAARLAHPAVVALYEAGQSDDGDWILVCELVRGPTLQVLMRDGDLSDRDVAEIGIALCDALEHAHGRGVVHRDLKPANVICPDATDEAGAVAKLTDFGVARLAGDDTLIIHDRFLDWTERCRWISLFQAMPHLP
ncbi:MAG: serine/threonine-protein kinase, partial [Baekduiaceae bacterium]